MKKLFDWCKGNVLFLLTLFLLAFIPLYPKLPLINITHVWVYVRLEDFFVLFTLLYWVVLLIRGKVSLKTPLTIPILVFWLLGAISTIHGILLIFPTIANVFPNVSFLSYLRRIEYMSLFFIAYSAMKDKKLFSSFVVILTTTILFVVLYGVGQKYFGFPAFLTMNEEFAKGVALQLSPLSRVSSTFGGHYDLAAYLVLVIPILISLVFGYKNWLIKIVMLGISAIGMFVLFMTVSRISFFAVVVALALVLFTQKKKLVLFSLPVLAIISVIFLSFSPSLLERFGNTVKEIDVLVDTKTGDPIGQVNEVSNLYFENKVVKQQDYKSIKETTIASPSANLTIPYTLLPANVMLYVQPNAPTGEDLPLGTGYVNLALAPIVKRTSNFFYERPVSEGEIQTTIINGDYLVKHAQAYDLSFTTRFQGEWPNALTAFERNVLFGSGYGSVSLAVDNNFLRILAEAGALGFLSFFVIFILLFVYAKRVLPYIESKPIKSFVIGFCAGIIGLAINAVFIDVFEASKVAEVFWLLMGITVGLLYTYRPITLDFPSFIKRIATSTTAIITYLLTTLILLFSPLTRNYFVGDDFTWFRWAAQSSGINLSTILGYFTRADGFFWRPGAKIYFLLMYKVFWLNQTAYHTVSLFLHFLVSIVIFLLAQKIVKKKSLAALTAFLFLTLAGYSEAVFWISATGFLFTSFFSLLSLLLFISWTETKKKIFAFTSVLSFIFALFFHELGIVTPFFFILYQWAYGEGIVLSKVWKNKFYQMFFLPIPLYLIVRFFARSLWMSGDYNYSIVKLPFNVIGNAIGYFVTLTAGPVASPVYSILRNAMRAHIVVAVIITLVVCIGGFFASKKILPHLKKEDMRPIGFATGFFLIALLPFLGLGNITSRYGYLSSIGILLLLVYLVTKLYVYLQKSGRDVAIMLTVLIVSIFSLLQIVEQKQVHNDWFEGGERVRNFVVSMNSFYSDGWTTSPMELHFVNVPIRRGDAWIFPVGLPDALWFIFRNPNMKVFTWATKEQAFSAVQSGSETQKVFIFQDDGSVVEAQKPRNIQ